MSIKHVALGAGCVLIAGTPLLVSRSVAVSTGPAVVVGATVDRAPSATAADWVTEADHVVVASVVDEAKLEPSSTEVERGEGLIQRDLTFEVSRVLWSRSDPAKPAPTTFSWLAFGWEFTDQGKIVREMTGQGEPRLEVGHTYILALDWQPSRCTPGDVVPAQWRGLGSTAVLPYDEGTIGQGELEGSIVTSNQAAATWEKGVEQTLAGSMAGENAPALARELDRAVPVGQREVEANENC